MTQKKTTLDPLEIIGAGLSHQTLNPLGVICSNAEIMTAFTERLRETVTLNEEASALLTQLEEMSVEIFDAAGRVNRTIQSLRRLSNLGCGLFPQRVDLSALAEELFLGPRVIHLTLEPDLFVYADRRALTQILLNLVENAREVGQRVWIKSWAAGEMACLSVEDDGPGVPPDERAHIFKPFYSSHDLQRKQGMGLCEAQLFAERMGGAVAHIEGARFQISFPRCHEPPPRGADDDLG
ncbi:HAMP domain-containing histidine kinase [Myxococcota bacterium]|nr:HAMP domain-containing histidine kinase [Myxococcota bacterium]MBU1431178.1 HAMP domain-containing histidine kinase [Myxococcota bacterium]MBU1896724.1 HAMP domain-containing histidine kinase [Myxococcota bacterium]